MSRLPQTAMRWHDSCCQLESYMKKRPLLSVGFALILLTLAAAGYAAVPTPVPVQ